MAESFALPDLVRHAGAVMTSRSGREVPAHYGSAAGELAVLVRGVGLAVRPDLVNLSIVGVQRALDQLVTKALGHGLAPGGAVFEGGAWWCRSADDSELVLLCHPGTADRLVRALRHEITLFANVELRDRSEMRVIINLLGPRARSVLDALGVFGAAGDPRGAAPFAVTSLRGNPVRWLLQADTSALAVVDREHAAAAWQALDDAGRSHGISCVGIESIDRYQLVERTTRSRIRLL